MLHEFQIQFKAEEKQRLEKEIAQAKIEIETFEASLKAANDKQIEYEEWKQYSNCIDGYINIRREKELTSFINEFNEKIDQGFIVNYSFKEKNIFEELVYFDHLSQHRKRLERLYLEGRGGRDVEALQKMKYAVRYIQILRDSQVNRIEYLTRYFLEDFERWKEMHKNPLNYGLPEFMREKNTSRFI